MGILLAVEGEKTRCRGEKIGPAPRCWRRNLANRGMQVPAVFATVSGDGGIAGRWNNADRGRPHRTHSYAGLGGENRTGVIRRGADCPQNPGRSGAAGVHSCL